MLASSLFEKNERTPVLDYYDPEDDCPDPEDQMEQLAPEGSVAVINITGPILKYGDLCTFGSEDYIQMIKGADENKKIASIVLNIDSPGGQVDGTASLHDVIKKCSKPVIAFVNDGTCASGAYWIASAADEIYCSQPLDQVGSIGVYCTLYDFNKYFESQGLPVYEIYAPESSDKNADVKEAFAGNFDILKSELSVIAQAFISTIKSNRGEKVKGTEKAWATGAILYAPQAIDAGLIDGIKSFDEVIARALELNPTNNTNNNTMSLFSKDFPTLSGLKNKAAAEITEADLLNVNKELTAAGLGSLVVMHSEAYTESLNKDLTLSQSLKEKEEMITSLNDKVSSLEKELSTARNTPAVSATPVILDGTDVIPQGGASEEDKFLTSIDKEARALKQKIN